MRRKTVAVLVAVIVLWLVSLPPQAALAHAVLVRSEPAQNARLVAAPQRIDLVFSEPLSHAFSTVKVLDTGGAEHDAHDVQFSADSTEMVVSVTTVSPGYYTVSWSTLSAADGHRWQGTFPFTVLNPDGSLPAGSPQAATQGSGTGVSPFDVALRWLVLLGLIGITGGFGFAALVLFPAASALRPQDRAAGRCIALHLLGAVVPVAAIVVVIANGAAFLREAELAGSAGAIGDLLSGNLGVNWLGREGLAIAAGVLAWSLARFGRQRRGPLVKALLAIGVVVGLGAVLTLSLTSHAAGGSGSAWTVPSDFIHLSGVALWLGGVVNLPVLLRLPMELDRRARCQLQGVALRRFSILAVISLALVLVSGTFNALVQIPTPAALADTVYGRTLLVKLVLLVPLLGLALLNGGRIARRFERLAHSAADQTEQQAQRLARMAVLESLAGAIVVAVTATLLFLVPAKDVAAQAAAQQAGTQPTTRANTYRKETTVGDLHGLLSISPNRVGENDFRVQLTGPGVDQVQRVQLRFQAGQGQRGQSTVLADPVPASPGSFAAAAANLASNGKWQITINVRRVGYDDVDGTVDDSVGVGSGGRSATAFPAHGITAGQTWLALALTAGGLLLLLGWRSDTTRRLPKPAWAITVGAFTVACTAVALAVLIEDAQTSGHWGETTTVTPLRAAGYTRWTLPTPASGLMMPAIGPDGRVWVGEMDANKLAVLDPTTNAITEFTYPGSHPVGTMGIAVTGDRVWLAQSSGEAIGEFDPRSGAYHELRTPTPNSSPSAVAADSRGQIWFTELGVGKIGRYDPATGAFTEYPIPTERSTPYWLQIASNGQVWFTELSTGAIGHLDPTMGRIDLITVPGVRGTTGIDVAADGSVWFGVTGGQLGHFVPSTGQISLMPVPSGNACGVAVDAQGTVWVASTSTTVHAFDPRTQAFQTFTTGDGSWWVAAAKDRSVWVVLGSAEGNALGRITPPATQGVTKVDQP